MKTATHNVPLGNYAELLHDRDGFQRWFCDQLQAEPGIRGHVLDIGCGPVFPRALRSVSWLPSQLDGVDPAADLSSRSDLTQKWSASFENAAIPSASYDVAFAFNVVEHIVSARPFLKKLSSVLKPGGVFWALTPHALHPFAQLVRTVQALRLKRWYASTRVGINEYPAYYRLNCVSHVSRAVDDGWFAKADFYRLPCTNWDSYFSPLFRFIPHTYDRLAGTRRGRCMLLFAMRLTRAES